jgi:hypothetical protein
MVRRLSPPPKTTLQEPRLQQGIQPWFLLLIRSLFSIFLDALHVVPIVCLGGGRAAARPYQR